MAPLNASFEEVADWCERHLEATRGLVGMTFGSAMRAYGQLATKTEHPCGAQGIMLSKQADEILLDFCRRFLVAYGWYEERSNRLAKPRMQSTNMTYDPGPQR